MRGAMKRQLDSINLEDKIKLKIQLHKCYAPYNPGRDSESEIIKVCEIQIDIQEEMKVRIGKLIDQVCGKEGECCG